MLKDEYDGFYILPGEDEEDPGGLNIAYFKFKEEEHMGMPVEGSPLGDMYHVAFFSRDINGDPMFDEEFEAIFADPSVYVKGLVGAQIYGCVLRKTEKSSKWWEEYLNRAKASCIMQKLINTAKLIAETKQF